MTYPRPCSRAHAQHCNPWHEQLVGGYRDAVFARDALRERGPGMQMEDDEFTAAHPPILFRDWLIAHRREDPDA